MDQDNMATKGHIFQINVSDGGVPKYARPEAEVTPNGLVGDHQRSQELHGGPERALCLYSLERVQALQAEGHPIYPGAAGENLTIAGIDWDQVTPGTQLRLGNTVLVEVTRYTSPCENISYAFLEDEFTRISQKVHPGWSRVYARVIQGGMIKTGDLVSLQ
jgi:MOSC domain-containing protein YiiM